MSAMPPLVLDVEKRRHRVALLMGGVSVERDVSLGSGRACADALEEAGYAVARIDVGADLRACLASLDPAPDAVFNALHGRGGEDGALQGVLDLLRIPYTHSGLLASALAMDKPAAKRIFAAAGLKVPDGSIITRETLLQGGDPLPRPYVVKPPAEGSSIGVRIVRPGDNARPFENEPWPFGEEVLVERFIPGRELTVGVIELSSGPQALGVTEIRPRSGFFDYQAKYTKGESEHICPADLPAPVFAEACRIAVEAHRALGCRGVSRADLRFDEGHGGAGLVLLEVNTQPGMTPVSLVPEMAAARGVPFTRLVAWMVEAARWG